MCHKYEFEHILDWSWSVIDAHCLENPSRFIRRCGQWRDIGRILNLSYQCERLPLAERIEQEWLNLIRNSDPPKSRAAFESALDVAENSPYLRRFHGEAYYTYLKATNMFNAVPSQAGMEMEEEAEYVDHSLWDFKLEPQRSVRLCRGFCSLTQLCLKLSVAPKIGDNPSCERHATVCIPGWDKWWKENSTSFCTHDPRELLLHIQGIALADQRDLYYTQPAPSSIYGKSTVSIPCSYQIKEKIRIMVNIFGDRLPDNFMIPS